MVAPGFFDEQFSGFARGARHALRRQAFSLCGNRDEAEDIVQEALIVLYLRWGHIENLPAYARTVTRREFLHSQRRGWRAREIVQDPLPEPPPVPDSGDHRSARRRVPGMARLAHRARRRTAAVTVHTGRSPVATATPLAEPLLARQTIDSRSRPV